MAKPFEALLLRRYTTAINTVLRQARTCGRVLAPGPTSRAPKQWK